MKSESSKKIDAIIAENPKKYLKEQDYKKSGRYFFKEVNELIHTIDFQASKHNIPVEANFTINTGIVFPYFHEKWTGTPLPKNIGRSATLIHRRVGHLMTEGKDFWWTVTPETNVNDVGIEIQQHLQNLIIPFLEPINTIDKCLELINSKTTPRYSMYNPDIIKAIIYNYKGNTQQSKSIITELRKTNKVKSFEQTIDIISERLKQ